MDPMRLFKTIGLKADKWHLNKQISKKIKLDHAKKGVFPPLKLQVAGRREEGLGRLVQNEKQKYRKKKDGEREGGKIGMTHSCPPRFQDGITTFLYIFSSPNIYQRGICPGLFLNGMWNHQMDLQAQDFEMKTKHCLIN